MSMRKFPVKNKNNMLRVFEVAAIQLHLRMQTNVNFPGGDVQDDFGELSKGFYKYIINPGMTPHTISPSLWQQG